MWKGDPRVPHHGNQNSTKQNPISDLFHQKIAMFVRNQLYRTLTEAAEDPRSPVTGFPTQSADYILPHCNPVTRGHDEWQ